MRLFRSIASAFVALILVCVCMPFSAYAAQSKWVGSWSTSPVETCVEIKGKKMSDFIADRTVRIILKPTVGGDAVRFKFSNEYGEKPLVITNIYVAYAANNPDDPSAIIPDTSYPVKFSGHNECVVPAGETLYSDSVSFSVEALQRIALSYYVKDYTPMRTGGLVGAETYLCSGKHSAQESMGTAIPLSVEVSGFRLNTVPFVTNMDVCTSPDAYSVVVIGDSTVCNDIPELLAEKLVASDVKNIGVLQQAIKGNRLLHEGVGLVGNLYGEAMLERFTRDAVEQTGVKKIFVKIGINDILHPRTASMEGEAPYSSAEEITAGFEKLCEIAHDAGVDIYFFTQTPWKGYTREILLSGSPDLIWSQEAEDMCSELTRWTLTNDSADGYVDLCALRDELDPYSFPEGYTTDGIHLSETAQIKLVDSIPEPLLGLSDKHLKTLEAIIAERLAQGKDPNMPAPSPLPQPGQPDLPDTQQPSDTESENRNVSTEGTAQKDSGNAQPGETDAPDTDESPSAHTSEPATESGAQKSGIPDICRKYIAATALPLLVAAAAAVTAVVLKRKRGKNPPDSE